MGVVLATAFPNTTHNASSFCTLATLALCYIIIATKPMGIRYFSGVFNLLLMALVDPLRFLGYRGRLLNLWRCDGFSRLVGVWDSAQRWHLWLSDVTVFVP